jgi:hypothetical protein
MWLVYRLVCLVGWHNWWDAGAGELVCLDCGRFHGRREQTAGRLTNRQFP